MEYITSKSGIFRANAQSMFFLNINAVLKLYTYLVSETWGWQLITENSTIAGAYGYVFLENRTISLKLIWYNNLLTPNTILSTRIRVKDVVQMNQIVEAYKLKK